MSHQLPDAIFFDLDDTLISFSANIEQCWLNVFRQYRSQVDSIPVDRLIQQIRDVSRWYWSDTERHRIGRTSGLPVVRRQLMELTFERLGIQNQNLAWQIADTYTDLRDNSITLFPDAKEVLTFFKERSVKMALLTNGNSDEQWGKIRRFKLEPYFNLILVEGEFGVGKPDLRVYQHALGTLKVTPEKTWMVGDNAEWEVAAPQKLGIYSIWYDHKNYGQPKNTKIKPDRIIQALIQLIDFGK